MSILRGYSLTLKVTFELEDKDLKILPDTMKKARTSAGRSQKQTSLRKPRYDRRGSWRQGAQFRVVPRREARKPDGMLADDEWALASNERITWSLRWPTSPTRKTSSRDSVPVLGYIDDAIMIELVVMELKPEIDAFEDFSRYKNEERSRNRNPDISRAQYLGG